MLLLFAATTHFAGLSSRQHASQAYTTAQLALTAQLLASLPLKIAQNENFARFEKASQEIGVPRGKKSERYRSTPL